MKRFKSIYAEATKLDDISVGVKKKLPAGVKGDDNLKGYAYNEKTKFKFKGKKTAKHIKNNAFLEGAEEITEKNDKLVKALEAEIKKYGPKDIDTPTYKDAIALVKKGDHKGLKKLIYTSDTEPSEFMAYAVAATDPAAFKKMYPRAKAGDYLRSIVIQHGESVDEIGTLKSMMEDIDMDEALSPAMKKKRLAMIRKAVEKINRQNAEKAKKDALKMMKDSGMFDENLEEDQNVGGYRDSSRDGMGPKAKVNAPKLTRIEQLKKQLEFAYKQREVHDEAQRKYMERAKEIRDRNPKDLGGIHGNEARADQQEELAQKQTIKIEDLKDQIADIRDKMESVINELSPELLKRYRDKAVKQFKQSDKKRNDPGYTDAKRKEHDKRAVKRFKGSQSASQKIKDRGGYSEVPAGHVKMTNDKGTVRYIGPSDVKKYQELGWKRTR